MFESLNVLTVSDKICQGKYLVNSVIVRFELRTVSFVGWDSVVGIATLYELDGLGIEFRWMRDFPHLSGPALVLIQLRVLWASSLFAGGELACSRR
jgi:hypothetical protein